MSDAACGSSGRGPTPVTTTERRRQFRADCSLAVPFRLVGRGLAGTARLTNLGLGGARIDFPVEVHPAEHVELTIAPEQPAGANPLQLEGSVVWTVAQADDGIHPAGLQFGEIGDALRRRLYAYVAALMR